MATPRNISPILDGFTLGELMSESTNARCYRAIQNYSHKSYIVKIISLPPSSVHSDALLVSGTISSPGEVNTYYKEKARDILRNVQVLRHMATIGGFIDYDCVQVVPTEDGQGYEVYLLCPFRQALPPLLQQQSMTHMDAVNLALDLCAALTVCRRSGYCYANLTPGNIFRQGSHYHIGDLGFLPLYEIGHSPLPEQYRSSYTAPELMDGTQPINDTADVYSLGLILYQIFSGGTLPGNDAVFGRLFLPPRYADYEMAEIILRACAPDPSIRWKGPEQMGRALMLYTQRNGMRNEPLVPAAQETNAGISTEDFLPEKPIEEAELSDADRIEAAFRATPRRKNADKARRKWSWPKINLRIGGKQIPKKIWLAIGLLTALLIVELIISIIIFL